jgi:hypothetical protein
MKRRLGPAGAALMLLAGSGTLAGDDLTGHDLLLCTAVEATVCKAHGECSSEPPWNLNIPQFLQVDLKDRTVSTTKASGENRMTPIKTLVREEGLIFIQGIEAGRAFSFVIEEGTGMASIAVARDQLTVSVFGACTPISTTK